MKMFYSNKKKTSNVIVNPIKHDLLHVLRELGKEYHEHVQLSGDKSRILILGSTEARVQVEFADYSRDRTHYLCLIDDNLRDSDKKLEIGFEGNIDTVKISHTVPFDIAKDVALYFLENGKLLDVDGFGWE